MPPLVSAVIPTHNRADLLPSAIDSVLRQRGGDLDAPGALEVIVVDDASTDDTARVLADYEPHVTVLRNPVSRERGASRNLGVAAASGKWVAFLDSDDEWEDEKLSLQLASAVGDIKSCVTNLWLVDAHGRIASSQPAMDDHAASEIECINPFRAAPSSLLIDRQLFLDLQGFPEDQILQGSEDWLLMARLLAAGHQPVIVKRPLVRYRVHEGNSTSDPSVYLRSTLAAVNWLERNGLVSAKRANQARAQKYEVAARAYALRRELRAAGRCLLHAAGASSPEQVFELGQRGVMAAARTAVKRIRQSLRFL